MRVGTNNTEKGRMLTDSPREEEEEVSINVCSNNGADSTCKAGEGIRAVLLSGNCPFAMEFIELYDFAPP